MRGEVNKRPSASALPVPVMIADKNPSVLDSLSLLLQSSIPGITLTLCSSHSYAMHSLTLARYQVVLCGVQYAEAGNFLLLNQHRAFQSFVPFIVIAEVAQSELAKRALEQQGVEDIVVWPLHQGQLEDSLREAMYLYQMRVTIAHRRQTLNTLRSWQSFPLQQPPRDRMDEYLLPRQSLQACERTIQRIETNLQYLTDVVDECERRAKMRAVEHLGLLGSSRR